MKTFEKLNKNEMKMIVGGNNNEDGGDYLWTGHCLITTTTNLGTSESYCFCAFRQDGSFYQGNCRNIDNIA